MKRNRYIAVMGTMGSGKTTAARLIAQKLGFQLLEENFGENAFLPRFYRDMKRWAFHSQTFFLMEKITQTRAASKLLDTCHVIQDTPIQQDAFSYAKAQHVLGNMDDAEWRLYLKIYHEFEPYFPKPDLIIFLEAPTDSLVKRVTHRGRTYEQEIPVTYLQLLDRLNHRWISENHHIKILSISTDTLNIATSNRDQKQFLARIENVFPR